MTVEGWALGLGSGEVQAQGAACQGDRCVTFIAEDQQKPQRAVALSPRRAVDLWHDAGPQHASYERRRVQIRREVERYFGD